MLVNILIINICYHDNFHACKGTRRVLFFTLLAGAPSLGTFPYSINVLPTKRCSFSVTLVWSPYDAFIPLFVQFYTVCLLYSYVFCIRTGQADIKGINAPLCLFSMNLSLARKQMNET